MKPKTARERMQEVIRELLTMIDSRGEHNKVDHSRAPPIRSLIQAPSSMQLV
jgi:hypothetical protein